MDKLPVQFVLFQVILFLLLYPPAVLSLPTPFLFHHSYQCTKVLVAAVPCWSMALREVRLQWSKVSIYNICMGSL